MNKSYYKDKLWSVQENPRDPHPQYSIFVRHLPCSHWTRMHPRFGDAKCCLCGTSIPKHVLRMYNIALIAHKVTI